MKKKCPNPIAHILNVATYGFIASQYFPYLLPVADPERQPCGGDPHVDKADLTLLQIIQGEQIDGPGKIAISSNSVFSSVVFLSLLVCLALQKGVGGYIRIEWSHLSVCWPFLASILFLVK